MPIVIIACIPKKQFDGQEEMCLALEAVQKSLEQFNAEHVANIIAGVSNSMIKSTSTTTGCVRDG